MRKRGQFFLIAALIIAVIVFSLGTIISQTRTSKEDITLFDLSDEISFEGSRVVDHGVFKGGNISRDIQNLSTIYKESNPNSDIIILYGNKSLITQLRFEEENLGDVGIGESILVQGNIVHRLNITSIIPENNVVEVILGNSTFEFDLREGQNFYIVVVRERGGEVFVAQR